MHSQKTPKIRVLVRKRPLSKKQQLKGENDIIKVQSNQSVLVHQQKYKVDLTPYIQQYKFNFDGVYDQFATNQQIYLTSIRPLVDCAFDGARVSCFAYGQTGSGKTHTMLGDGMNVHGMYLLAAADIFQQLQQYQKLSVWISFYEIYCGKLYDLLNERNILFAREDAKNNVNIVGLSERKISSIENIMQIIHFGTGVRVTAQNGTNVDSSRSHAILQITLKNGNKVHGKISFIDLAGSERAADHADQLQKQTRIDGAEINKSLLALKECIRALDQNKNHTPFRGSKLTMVLKDSFTGYCRTVMIGNISPNSSSCENTLNTLKYADRVKELKKPNKEQQMLQLDNLDQLSRELMLPRQMVNHKKYENKVETNNNHENDPVFNYGSNNHQANMVNQNKKYSQKFQQKHQQPLFTKANRISNPIPQAINSPYKQPFSKYQVPFQSKNLVQQEEPQNLNYQSLQKQHENYIQTIIQEEQQLMKTHEKHINTTIDLVKQEMFLMGQADKIGSNVEEYLNSLQIVLERELSSIKQVKDKVIKMKKNLNQSKRVQQLYIQASKKMFENHEPEISLLDDDDHLFN